MVKKDLDSLEIKMKSKLLRTQQHNNFWFVNSIFDFKFFFYSLFGCWSFFWDAVRCVTFCVSIICDMWLLYCLELLLSWLNFWANIFFFECVDLRRLYYTTNCVMMKSGELNFRIFSMKKRHSNNQVLIFFLFWELKY